MCQPDPANEFGLTVCEPEVAAWYWSPSGLRGQEECEKSSVVLLHLPSLRLNRTENNNTRTDPVYVYDSLKECLSPAAFDDIPAKTVRREGVHTQTRATKWLLCLWLWALICVKPSQHYTKLWYKHKNDSFHSCCNFNSIKIHLICDRSAICNNCRASRWFELRLSSLGVRKPSGRNYRRSCKRSPPKY